ncbi:MAG: 2-aminoethylphosphonate--pyruvate transaminase [Gammaproteobacteria bacterium]|nr:2-aminoethylphosphonate--pyruvate transaminase [Gammaproteobacteria bacterium]
MILLNPGPVTLSTKVREAMLGPDLCHREPEFAQLQAEIRRRLLDVYGLDKTDWASILLTGSGTAAVEAMLSSVVPRNGHVLVIENGTYGERMTKILQRYGMPHSRIEHTWLEAPDLSRIEQQLATTPEMTHVAVVHHETTSGRLNDLKALGECCRRYRVSLLVDAVSSFGAEELDFNELPIAAIAATANKCLHGVPGTCFAIASREALASAGNASRTVYLDLQAYLEQQDRHGTPFTQSVQTFYALAAALRELEDEGGWRTRRHSYLTRINAVRSHLRNLGIEPLLAEGLSSCVLHAFYLPPTLSYANLHDALKARGFVIYAGQSNLAQQIFRISMMGEITPSDIARLCAALTEAIRPN